METECGIVIEYLEHNKALEQSPEFQKIEQEVDKEVYTQFALEHIQMAEQDMAEYGDYEEPEYNDEFEFGDESSTSDDTQCCAAIFQRPAVDFENKTFFNDGAFGDREAGGSRHWGASRGFNPTLNQKKKRHAKNRANGLLCSFLHLLYSCPAQRNKPCRIEVHFHLLSATRRAD